MAKSSTRRINIYINGKEVEATVKSIRSEMNKLINEQNRMTIGSDEYIAHAKKIQQLRGYLQEHSQNIDSVAGTWEKLQRKMMVFGAGMGGFTQMFSAFNNIVSTLKQTATDLAAMDDIYSDVIKTTTLTHEQVEKLNSSFKKMDIGIGIGKWIKNNIELKKTFDFQKEYKNVLVEVKKEYDRQASTVQDLIKITGSKEFDMILVNYLGRKPSKVNNSCYYEHAAPVCLDSSGNREQGIDLTATGEHSVGETYAAPWLRFLASHEKVCHYFLLPATIFMEVLQLLKPQDVPISNQKRFVIIDSVKLMPIKMNFQFTEGSRNIIAEIHFAKEKVEL